MADVEVLPGNVATVGGATVVRHLPKRTHRTIGPWCFADHFGPADIDDHPMAVGPHPHIGLQTVTWLYAGEVLHTDSIGSEQLIRPGQLNLMSAGRGIAHAEQSPGDTTGTMHGMQFWVAQPDATRHGAPAFEHHTDLPLVEVDGATGRLMLGSWGDAISPARTDWPMVGVELAVPSGRVVELPVDPGFEHGLLVPQQAVEVDGVVVPAGQTAYLDPGRSSVRVSVVPGVDGASVFRVGGRPFEAEILMSWNFVGRDRDEIDAASSDWASGDDRFGEVRSSLDRIAAPPTR